MAIFVEQIGIRFTDNPTSQLTTNFYLQSKEIRVLEIPDQRYLQSNHQQLQVALQTLGQRVSFHYQSQ